MKSFRLYLERPATPSHFADELSSGDCVRLREAFATMANRYRFQAKIAFLLFVVGIACGFVAVLFVQAFQVGSLICLTIAILTVLMLPPLSCPNCSNRIDKGFGPFCPECGAKSLDSSSWFRAPHCSTCSRELRNGKARHYRIRACTRCGLWLDKQGI